MRKFSAVALLIAASLVLAACGSGSGGTHGSSMGSMMDSGGAEKSSPVVPGAREIVVLAKAYRFEPATIKVAAGEAVTIVLTATDLPHDVTVEGVGHIVHAGGGKTTRGGVKITKPGTYSFYCSVKGHRAEGMIGKLVVS